MKSLDGWAKTLGDVRYHEEINKNNSSSSTLIKKNFQRGSKLLDEQYIDLHSVHAKEDNDVYVVKGLCEASLRQVDRWVIFVLKKRPCQVYFAYCQCTAGTAGTCSHAFALMKMVSKWNADSCVSVPEAVACTSKQ